MPFVTHQGVENVDSQAMRGRIILSHPDVPHSLVLNAVSGEDGYQSTLDGWKTTDGRTRSASLRIAGGYQNPVDEIQATFQASKNQVLMFDWLKRAQDESQVPITCQDFIQKVAQTPGAAAPAWLAGSPTTGDLGIDEGYQAFVCWIDTDRGYKTPVDGNLWWTLQFQVLKEV